MEVCAAIGVSFLRDDDELKQNAVATATDVSGNGNGLSNESRTMPSSSCRVSVLKWRQPVAAAIPGSARQIVTR